MWKEGLLLQEPGLLDLPSCAYRQYQRIALIVSTELTLSTRHAVGVVAR